MAQVSAVQTVSPSQMAAALRRAGFPIATIPVMVAVGLAESGGNVHATHVNSNGSTDYGVWQVNSIHGFNTETLLTLDGNAAAAKTVYDKQGLRAWSTYNSGSYRKYAAAGQQGAASPDATASAPTSNVQGFGIPGAGTIDWLQKAGGYLTSGDFWKRVGLVVGGTILLIAGFVMFAKTEVARNVGSIVGSTTKVARKVTA
jgi:hypothetical protein